MVSRSLNSLEARPPVFLAEATRFDRRVVVKVELTAGVSAERFEREALLAATLHRTSFLC